MKLTKINTEPVGVKFDELKPGNHFLYNSKLWLKVKMIGVGKENFDYYAILR